MRWLGLAVLFVLYSHVVVAQQVVPMPIACFPDDQVDARLSALGESIIGIGLTPAGGAVAVWMNADNHEFTVTLTEPGSGTTCLVFAGEQWEIYPPDAPKKGDPS